MDPEVIDTDPYAEIDATEIAGDIAASLFSKGEKPAADTPVVDAPVVETPVVETRAAAATPPVDPAAPAVVPGENSVPTSLPKSWKKEMAPEWEKTSPAVKAYVIEREAQIMRGINQYQQGYQAWDNLIKPFQPILAQNPDVNPIVLMQGLMATHLQLLSPEVPQADKTALVTNLLKSYGLSLEPGTGPSADSALVSRLARAEARLQEIDRRGKTFEKIRQDEQLATFTAQVEAFAADPKNEHYPEVANDILRFISTGVAKDLQSAYDHAIWVNPAVRAKMLAKQQAPNPSTAQQTRGKDGKFINIEGDGESKVKAKPGTMDQTINAVIAKHYTKH